MHDDTIRDVDISSSIGCGGRLQRSKDVNHSNAWFFHTTLATNDSDTRVNELFPIINQAIVKAGFKAQCKYRKTRGVKTQTHTIRVVCSHLRTHDGAGNKRRNSRKERIVKQPALPPKQRRAKVNLPNQVIS